MFGFLGVLPLCFRSIFIFQFRGVHMMRLCLAVTICLGMACSIQATTIWSWEDTVEGWSMMTGHSSTIGAIDGAYSATFDPTNGFTWGLQTGNWNPNWAAMEAALAVNSIVRFDVTTTNEDPGDGE